MAHSVTHINTHVHGHFSQKRPSLCDRSVFCVWESWRRVAVLIGRWCWHGNRQSGTQSQRSSFLLQLPDLQTGQTTRASGHGKLIENNKDSTKLLFFFSPIPPPNDRIMQQFPSQLFDVWCRSGKRNMEVKNVVSKVFWIRGGILCWALRAPAFRIRHGWGQNGETTE